MSSTVSFSVADWLAANPPASCTSVHVSQPQQLGVGWTKSSATASSGGSGGGSGSGSSSAMLSSSTYSFNDTTGLLPFVAPRLPASLDNPGITYIPKDSAGQEVGVETVIRAAAAACADLGACSVLTFRNNLNKIFGTPFDPRSAWAVDACLLPAAATGAGGGSSGGSTAATSGQPGSDHSSGSGSSGGGTLFLDIWKLEEAWSGDRADMERFVRWGYTFEALCTGQAVADSTLEYGALVRTRIAQHRMFIGAEIDCYDPIEARAGGRGQPPPPSKQERQAHEGQQERQQQPTAQQQSAAQQQQAQPPQPPGLASYIELKTYRLPSHPGQQRSLYRFKHPKWWLQSFLAGVPRLALGARDDQGTLVRLDLVHTADLPRLSAQNGAPWSAHQALRFGSEALAWMREQAERWPGQHLRFSYDPTAAGSSSSGGGGGRGGRGGHSSGGSGAGAAISCEVLPGGQLPQRIQWCLRECGLAAGRA